MERRTREYLTGRFGDYYRGAAVTPPPAASDREWGHIPFTSGEGTTMVRHQSLLDIAGGPADLPDFLAREGPRHVYFSAARYDDPGSRSMAEKGWQSADLIFDLDADHLPSVDPETASYPEMLAACKEALVDLLDLLQRDFGFGDEEMQIVFSGSRGYHVHVRDESVRTLDSDARREIVDYVRGIGLDEDGLIESRPNENGVLQKHLRLDGGWGRRVHEELLSYADELREMSQPAALERLQELDGVGETTADSIHDAVTDDLEQLRRGNLEIGSGARTLVRALTERVVDDQSVPVDEPVTTDLRRLIRLPGSLHGDTGFVVEPIELDAVAEFDPLEDAVAERFRGRRVMIDVTDPGPVPVGGDGRDDSFRFSEGTQSVREFVGVYLLARGRAEKAAE